MAQPADVDAKEYYAYLFQANKQPTKVLTALLKAIAKYIRDHIGDLNEKTLTPAKLASFYKAVGGNYDQLFVDVPHSSISWIFSSIGCQHTLQPTNDLFSPPSIPALTEKGFVNWQCIETLLQPEEHVPFIQYAVKNFPLVHPDTGESFPKDLPKEAFPLVSDAGIVKWHNECAEKLRRRATPDEDRGPTLPPRPSVQPGVRIVDPARTRSQSNYTTSRPKSDYFDERQNSKMRAGDRERDRERHIPYNHVSSTSMPSSRPVRPKLSSHPSHRDRAFLAPEASPDSPRLSRSRRRSVPENMNSPVSSPHGVPSPDPREAPNNDHIRRHSHPRMPRRGSLSSDGSSEGEAPSPVVANKRRPKPREEGPSIRFEYPSPVSPMPASPDMRPRPRDRRPVAVEERRSYPIPIDMDGKLSAPFLLSKRNRESPRNNSRGANVRWKDLGDVKDAWKQGSKSSEEDRDTLPRRRVSRHDADVDRDRDSGSGGGSRSDFKRGSDREVPRARQPRYSSHEGSPRIDRDREWERDRDRDREHDYDRDREREVPGRSFRERDRERRGMSPVRGVDGRFYPGVR